MFAGGGERWANVAFAFGLPWSLLFTQLGLVSAKSAPANGWLLVLAVSVNTGVLWGWRTAGNRRSAGPPEGAPERRS